jgi:ribosomal-protein-alanine N-acetyltransferase
VILREPTGADAGPVHALDELVFGLDAWSLAGVVDELTGAGRYGVVAVLDGTVVGYAITLRWGDSTDLQRIGVHPERRRQRIGEGLLGLALEHARQGGSDRMLLEVSARNHVAMAFYRAEGFAEIGRRSRYYRDGSDAVVMELWIDEPAATGEESEEARG